MAQDVQDGRSPDALNGRLRLPITGTPAWPAFDQSLIAEIDWSVLAGRRSRRSPRC